MSRLTARLRQVRRITVGAMVALSAVGCTIQDAKAPPLQGPSEFALAFTLSAVPDVLTQDGASQAQIIVQARDANGQPARNVTFRVDTTVNGALADFGSLSARTLVTGNDGRAILTYTAPPSITGGVDIGQEVTIQVTPFGTDFSNTISRTVRIRLIPPGVLLPGGPTPAFTVSPAGPTAGSDVTFDASTSVPAPSTQIVSYAWDFGDGGTGTSVVAFHRFAAGSYVVTLTVSDTNGISASAQKSLTVGPGALPTADFVFSPSAPTVNQNVLFNASTSKAGTGRSIVRYDWNMGSGPPQCCNVTATKQYDTAGSYTVVLTVTDDIGQTATSSKPVAVSAAVVTSSFTFFPTTPHSGDTVNFNGSASSSPSPITNYAWDWGDGTPASPTNAGATMPHVFTVPGPGSVTFTVTLVVTDSLGRQATSTRAVIVAP